MGETTFTRLDKIVPDWTWTFLFRAFCSSILTGVVITIAVFTYAANHSARWPVEGIPHSVAISALVGTCLTIAALALALLAILTKKAFAATLRGIQFVMRKLGLPNEASLQIGNRLITFKSAQGQFRPFKTFFNIIGPLVYLLVFTVVSKVIFGTIIAIISFAFSLIYAVIEIRAALNRNKVSISEKFNRSTDRLYIKMFLFVTYILAAFLFSPFLGEGMRASKFGGGLPITITTTDNEKFETHLFLTTNSHIMVWNTGRRGHDQFPLAVIKRIEFRDSNDASMPPTEFDSGTFGLLRNRQD